MYMHGYDHFRKVFRVIKNHSKDAISLSFRQKGERGTCGYQRKSKEGIHSTTDVQCLES